MIDIEDIRRDHIRYTNRPWGGDYCRTDNQRWPCVMTQALDELEQLRKATRRVVAAYDEYPEGSYPDPDDVFFEIRELGRVIENLEETNAE